MNNEFIFKSIEIVKCIAVVHILHQAQLAPMTICNFKGVSETIEVSFQGHLDKSLVGHKFVCKKDVNGNYHLKQLVN